MVGTKWADAAAAMLVAVDIESCGDEFGDADAFGAKLVVGNEASLSRRGASFWLNTKYYQHQ